MRAAFYSLAAGTAFIWGVGCGSSSTASPPGPDSGVSGSSGAGGGGGSGEPILDGGGVVPSPPDGATLCPAGVCNYQTNQGCTSASTCAPLPSSQGGGSVSPACQPAGAVANGGSCTAGSTECAPGTICAEGHCHKLCCGTATFGDYRGCPQGEHCLRPLKVQVSVGGPILSTGAYLCFPVNQCDALDPVRSCVGLGAPNTACQLADPTGATACLPEGAGQAGDPCPCSGGFTCVGDGCRRLCRAVAGGGEPSCPPAEGSCVHFNRDPAGVGECTPQ